MVPWAHPSLRPKWHVDWLAAFAQLTMEYTITLQFTMGHYVFFQKLPHPLRYRVPHLTHDELFPNSILIGSASGEENPQNCPVPFGI